LYLYMQQNRKRPCRHACCCRTGKGWLRGTRYGLASGVEVDVDGDVYGGGGGGGALFALEGAEFCLCV
jgi:hypothetical protein